MDSLQLRKFEMSQSCSNTIRKYVFIIKQKMLLYSHMMGCNVDENVMITMTMFVIKWNITFHISL